MAAVVYPLEQFFLRGFWRGKALKDICAELTNNSSDFWNDHLVECEHLVYREFDSWLAYAEIALYFLFICAVVWRCCRRT